VILGKKGNDIAPPPPPRPLRGSRDQGLGSVVYTVCLLISKIIDIERRMS
jgi:hypothetical protein